MHLYMLLCEPKIRNKYLVSCILSAWQMIHIQCQALFSQNIKKDIVENVMCYNFSWCFKGKYFSVKIFF